AGARFHVHALLPVLGQPVGHHAPDDVGGASRGVADEDAHRLVRILGVCRGGGQERQQSNESHAYLIEKSFLPTTGISAARISPFSESVMKRLLPRNAM